MAFGGGCDHSLQRGEFALEVSSVPPEGKSERAAQSARNGGYGHPFANQHGSRCERAPDRRVALGTSL